MKWYRSLYWRIALGVVGFLAAMLVVQAMLFVWAVSQSGRTLPGQSPGRLGMTVALDLASVLERDPQTDLARYVHEQYAQYTHPFFVMMADGTRDHERQPVHRRAAARDGRARCALERTAAGTPRRAARWSAVRPAGADRSMAASGRIAAIGRLAFLGREPTATAFVRPAPIIVDGDWPASSSCRRRRRSDSCSAASRRCSRSSRPACWCVGTVLATRC